MLHRLITRVGNYYHCPSAVVKRLESEFAYVETSEEDARRHVLEIIEQLIALKQGGKDPVGDEDLIRLERIQESAIGVCFGDDLTSDLALLNTYVIPGEPLLFEYSSPAHEEAARPVLRRCADVLGYEIVTA
jgi:hypothetical protein